MASHRNRIVVQYAVSRRGVPSAASLRKWAQVTMKNDAKAVCIRIVGNSESRNLNLKWRKKDKPTNVLSFPYSSPSASGLGPSASLLGDLVICAPVVAHEARQQGKLPAAHWAHMVVHGVLHLRGFDHVKNRDAKRMEALEVKILSLLGFQNPYVTGRFAVE